MSSPLNDAASNALRIAGELVAPDLETLLCSPHDGRFPQIVQAAACMAAIENEPGFQWNENGRPDWETFCAEVARRIERRQPVSINHLRRLLSKLSPGKRQRRRTGSGL